MVCELIVPAMDKKKNKSIMRPRLIAFSLVALLGSLSMLGCDESDDNPEIGGLTFKATMHGYNQVPANGSGATGTATLTFDSKTRTLKGTVTYTGLTINAAHIHKGLPGVSGPVIFPFTKTSLVSPIRFTSPVLTAEQQADLNAGLYYVNLNTEAYPDGEIRGQLTRE
jgi:hypothetical protein